ncbi:MAG: ATP-dependent Clp protease proteolytic subunit [Oscillospiraceae bacterium]|nr:ATP-dependent Clp protease proteolytic subunit [Oscillospiraceae bacterium]
MRELAYIDETAKGNTVIPLHSRLLTERQIFLTGEITAETAVDFLQAMLFLMNDNKPIDIYINSCGGEINAGLAIYDMIQSCKNKLNMYCVGQASSMAAVLLASGQKGRRFILPHSRVMIHEALLRGGVSGSATSISRISESILETRDMVNGILAEHTGKTLEEINSATGFDNMMNAEEAVSFGICDKIVGSISERSNA